MVISMTKRPAAIFIGFCNVITDIACMQILLTSVTHFNRGDAVRLEPLVWVMCALAMYALNCILMSRSAAIPALVGANAAGFALALFALIRTAPALTSFFGYAITVVFSIFTAVEAFRFAVKKNMQNSQIIRFDVYIILLVWKFIALEGGMARYDLPFLLIVLALNIICNLVLRSSEENVGRALPVSPVAGTFFSVGLFALMAAVVFGFVRLFASGSRTVVEMLISVVQNGVWAVFSLLGRFFMWLFSLVTFREMETDYALEAFETAGMEAVYDQLHFPAYVLHIVAAAFAGAAIAAIVYLVFRFRKTRVSAKSLNPASLAAPVRRIKGAGRFKRRLESILGDIIFAIKSIRHINTPQGTLVSLERWGKKRGNAKKPGQTMREYLVSLSPALVLVADDLDAIYFGSGSGCLSKADCRKIRREFFSGK
jgi:hypothetical protein